jgi:hypothetical protein
MAVTPPQCMAVAPPQCMAVTPPQCGSGSQCPAVTPPAPRASDHVVRRLPHDRPVAPLLH